MVLLATISLAAAENSICTALQNTGMTAGMDVPGYVPYKNERINVYTNEGQVVASVILTDKTVTSLTCNSTTDPTMNVYVQDAQTVTDVFNAASPIDAAHQKVKAGAVRIEGVTPAKKVKTFFAKIGLGIASWFA